MKRMLLVCFALIIQQLGLGQLPVAGLNGSGTVLTLGMAQYAFNVTIPNTSTGNITSWRYEITRSSGQPVATYNYTAPHANFYFNHTAFFVPEQLNVKQVVSDGVNRDSVTVSVDVNCNAVTPPIAYWVTATANPPSMSFSAMTTDYAGWIDLAVSSPYLVTSGNHPGSGFATDVFSAPGPVVACASYYYCTCCGTMAGTCDTFDLPCWQAPLVTFSGQVSGADLSLQSSVNALAGASYHWDFGDGQTSTVANPTHTYGSIGDYVVCLTVTDSCGATTACDTFSIATMAAATSPIGAFSCMPNPSQGRFLLEFERDVDDDYVLTISDLSGRVQYENAWSASAGTVQHEVEIVVPAGIYLMAVATGNGARIVRKVQVE